MNGFIKKSIGTLTLGEKLKKLRSDRRISLSEVSKHTRIQVKYLEYLEEGRYEKLPADVYVRGFLKNYADFLGVDANILIRLYEKEKGIKDNLEKNKNRELAQERAKPLKINSFVLTPKIITISSIILLTLGGFFYLYKEVGSFASAPILVVLSPEQNAFISGNAVLVEGKTEKDARLFINEQAILVNDDGKFREELTLQAGNNFITVKAVNRFEKETVQTLTVQSNYQNENEESNPEEDKIENASLQKEIEIELKIDPGPVWINVEADGNLVFNGTMLTGATQKFKAANEISINSGNGKATFVKFNNKDIGTLGKDSSSVHGVKFTSDTAY